MTVVAIWCRHQHDNIIGIGYNLPWKVESDTKKFLKAINDQIVVMGRKTYDNLRDINIGAKKIYILTNNPEYETTNASHIVINKITPLKDIEEDIYIAGGAMIYQEFLTKTEKLKPHIIVDCIYQGNINITKTDNPIDITNSIEIVEKNYRQITPYYIKDNVASAILVKKGEFIDQQLLKKLLLIFEET